MGRRQLPGQQAALSPLPPQGGLDFPTPSPDLRLCCTPGTDRSPARGLIFCVQRLASLQKVQAHAYTTQSARKKKKKKKSTGHRPGQGCKQCTRRSAPAGARRPGGQGRRAGAAAENPPRWTPYFLLPRPPPAPALRRDISPLLCPSPSLYPPVCPPFFDPPPPLYPAFLLLQENNLTVDLLTGEEFASWI